MLTDEVMYSSFSHVTFNHVCKCCSQDLTNRDQDKTETETRPRLSGAEIKSGPKPKQGETESRLRPQKMSSDFKLAIEV